MADLYRPFRVYGYAIALKDTSLEIWDGSFERVNIKKGDKLAISYFEHNGVIGLTQDDKELHCSLDDRLNFEEHWR